MPFVTEQIWQHLNTAMDRHARPASGESIMLADYPTANFDLIDADAEEDITTLMDVVRSIRNVRAEMRIEPTVKMTASIHSDEASEFLAGEVSAIELLARANIGLGTNGDGEEITVVLRRATVGVSMDGEFDLSAAREKLISDLDSATNAHRQLEGRLSNEKFLAKAPDEVVDKERERLAETADRISRLRQLVGTGN